MKQTVYDMMYLTVCAVNGSKPNAEYIARIDLEKLFQICKFHSLTAIVCMALESAGIFDKKFVEAKLKAIRKNILLDAQREKICVFMEQNGIWYMPLKGVILKELYPKIGMRQMADNDILYDKSARKQVFKYMRKNGYTVERIRKSHHDSYIKPPVYNFEMHTSLFGKNHDEIFYSYYSDVKKRLVREAKKSYAYWFTDEDFYVYMTAHEYKHYSSGGTGLRSLMDCFVFVKEKGNSLNWSYIMQQTDLLGISEFERKSRELSIKIFTNPNIAELSGDETKMLEYYLFSGTYGTMKNAVNKRIKTFRQQTGSTSKFRYIWSRIFPPIEFYKQYFPFFYKYKLLLPIAWGFRFVRGITFGRKRMKSELNFVYQLDESNENK